ncbi:hypothetical protein ACN42_g6582 [Penicillium freii]|uniref:Uncharacterized protein n=1 Tax=Penicillium freii TaxID=48697 RepID=A0A101MHI6_PENFR|nr:hypothetical protein ACN42_g6582 [Penicillium freii]
MQALHPKQELEAKRRVGSQIYRYQLTIGQAIPTQVEPKPLLEPAQVGSFLPFQQYVDHVSNARHTMHWHIGDSTQAANGLGIMELPRRKQELVIAGNGVDEELVVSSLLAFLEAITLRHPDVKCD